MSTFDGRVAEFPDIRIDFFRPNNSDSTPALAYFLSHVHSDHLVGLESCKSPFIYCSPATRDILLRLEKYPHRMNFAKGILETRKRNYRHLKNLLKAIPLETPTVIELHPGKSIRVTLFCANHCVGAVMFLIEGDGKAVLYTGDVRSETWWVDSLTRHPILLPYVCSLGLGLGVKLDCIYLDTTFTVSGREDHLAEFPPKAVGLRELLEEVAQYPPETLFYLDAWTFGYEEVWQALSTFLSSRIHVDEYRYGLYRALVNGVEPKATESTKLVGYYCGNHFQQGCLSRCSDECRIHSCEKGTGCDIWSKDFVRITPVISRYGDVEIAEVGAGGGHGDLNEQHELDVSDPKLIGQLMALCASKLHGQPQLLSTMLQMLTSIVDHHVQSFKLEDFNLTKETMTSNDEEFQFDDMEEISLEKLVSALARMAVKEKQKRTKSDSHEQASGKANAAKRLDGSSKQITFPYSRHSSYNELCRLIRAFVPKNIHPCTVDETNWTLSSSMSSLFGHLYSTIPSFRHDQVMLIKTGAVDERVDNDNNLTASGSLASSYATPKENASPPNVQNAPKSTIQSPPVSAKSDNPNEQQANDHKTSSKRTSRQERQPQGDFWPPQEIDHYSPPSDTKRRAMSPGSRPNQVDQDGAKTRTNLTTVEDFAIEPVENRRRKRAAEALPREWQLGPDETTRKRSRTRQSSEFGRLSPPSSSRNTENDEIDIHDHFDKLFRRRKDSEVKDVSKRWSYSAAEIKKPSSPAQNRLAFRKEVHDAVLGKNGSDWNDISLVSVKGHQVKEEEL